MKIEVKIESTYQEPKVIIFTDHMTDEVNEIIRKLSESIPHDSWLPREFVTCNRPG